MNDDRDEMIERVAAALSPLPAVDPAARARVLVAVAAERERGRELGRTRARNRRRWAVGGGVAAAALLATALWLPSRQTRVAPSSLTAARSARAEVATGSAVASLASGRDLSVAPRQIQLVFRAPEARRVSVVGDFTAWDANPGAMTRDPESGLWSVTLSLTPGRHVYAFLVDDTLWVRDPRAAVAPDLDFGRPGSVLMVDRP